MIRDPWFIEKVNWLKKRFMGVGCPIPQRFFKTYKAYLSWNKKYWERYAEMERSSEFLEAKQRITENKEMMSKEEFEAFEGFKEDFLPPEYGKRFNEILKHFNIDPKNKGFCHFLEFYLFFGETEYHTSPFSITHIRNFETNEMEMFIRIYRYTKKEDILRHWDWVARDQKHLKDFVGKNKAWKTFDRDIEIYNYYKEIKDPKVKRQINYRALDARLWVIFEKKWPKLTTNHIRAIINRTRKRLGEI